MCKLKEGGNNYNDINKGIHSYQLRVMTVFELLISGLIILFVILLNTELDYIFIAFAFGINLIVFLPRNYLSYVLQATNRHKENALITIIGRSVFLILIVVFSVMKVLNYKAFVLADIGGKLVALIYACVQCKELFITKPNRSKQAFHELLDSIKVGINLMLASVSSLVTVGIVRLAIQKYWSVSTYGTVSFTLTVTNLVLTFISAVSIVLYPTLRKVSYETSVKLYMPLRELLETLLLASLVFCCPLQAVLSIALPQYSEGIRYLPILFPVCIYSAKITMLVQTYMQVYRMEKKILLVNSVSIIFSIFSTIIAVVIYRNLTFAIATILLTQMFRCYFAEHIIVKKLQLSLVKENIMELLLVSAYVTISYCFGRIGGMMIYSILFAIYLVIKKQSIVNSIHQIRYIN